MISQAARDSFERIFFQAVRSRLAVDPTHACEIVRVSGQSAIEGGIERDSGADADVVVLTIASIGFRIVILLQFADDDATRGYSAGQRAPPTPREATMEVGNLFCGAVNQQLVEHFPDLGMSTPYALSSDCMGYLDELKPTYIAAYEIAIEHVVGLRATLCVCTSTPLDFVAQAADMEECAGELELF